MSFVFFLLQKALLHSSLVPCVFALFPALGQPYSPLPHPAGVIICAGCFQPFRFSVGFTKAYVPNDRPSLYGRQDFSCSNPLYFRAFTSGFCRNSSFSAEHTNHGCTGFPRYCPHRRFVSRSLPGFTLPSGTLKEACRSLRIFVTFHTRSDRYFPCQFDAKFKE